VIKSTHEILFIKKSITQGQHLSFIFLFSNINC